MCRISITALPSAVSSPFCLGNGDERSFGPVQKMDVLVRAVRQFGDSGTEVSFRSPVPRPRREPVLNKQVLLGTVKTAKKYLLISAG